jgi:hypothetical protein
VRLGIPVRVDLVRAAADFLGLGTLLLGLRSELGLVPAQRLPFRLGLLAHAGFRGHLFFLGGLVGTLFTVLIAHRSSLPQL